MTREIGTPMFMAPELIEGADYSFPVDVYAYGMMMFIVLTESYPFPKIKDPFKLSQMIMDGIRPEIPPCVPAYYQELIADCWDQNPSARRTFAQIIENPDDLMFELCDQDVFDNYKLEVLKLK
jgi:serine/threonine protein kinase